MKDRLNKLFMRMVAFDHGDPELIQHFTKVHAYAKYIAENEGMAEDMLETLEAAAIVHDIAIPLCREKYGSDAGPLQEKEGPALVRAMFSECGYDETVTERVCSLVANHHTYEPIIGMDHQILVEADFLVNAYESHHAEEAKRRTLEKIFRTETGKSLFRTMYDL